MPDVENLKAEIKKLSAKAVQAKMDLHDLSEELPLDVENVVAVAERVRDAYAALDAKRAVLKSVDCTS